MSAIAPDTIQINFREDKDSNAVQQTPSAKIRAAEGFHPMVNFQQHNHHRPIAKD
jgi:hypothetical protein